MPNPTQASSGIASPPLFPSLRFHHLTRAISGVFEGVRESLPLVVLCVHEEKSSRRTYRQYRPSSISGGPIDHRRSLRLWASPRARHVSLPTLHISRSRENLCPYMCWGKPGHPEYRKHTPHPFLQSPKFEIPIRRLSLHSAFCFVPLQSLWPKACPTTSA